jgi:hypothetical protein
MDSSQRWNGSGLVILRSVATNESSGGVLRLDARFAQYANQCLLDNLFLVYSINPPVFTS